MVTFKIGVVQASVPETGTKGLYEFPKLFTKVTVESGVAVIVITAVLPGHIVAFPVILATGKGFTIMFLIGTTDT